ncbi:2-hydroxyhepta-2,4-diene-1,7-dioate isomerase [Vibrio nigripulchritudo]|uniref:fumarylacetoacetate hydrolase family protein n=1 Tax=Vibrio nigripulchritudo TaxID=28173 RepID=UPI0019095002|nr:fumarylacetoacetate hydrolase family protein [Vibrio nigripulchritudo]BCL70216.1 2-hydroxyhepta-2,4-diene-1,7-dioate isomerase [Vibrio nigripulchritudo]BDU31566.1 2-hydroxyhepta-2,4-diene-1,7-dioate isomerase [Vibrio nigripulchritudo]
MKLVRVGEAGSEKPGVELNSGKRIDVSAFGEDYTESFFGSDGPKRLSEWLDEHQGNCPEFSENERYGAPICRPSKIICVGLNYKKHAEESGMPIPGQPVLFMKATSSLCGPNDPIIIPKNSHKTDWEVELAIVIGKRASYVSEEDALEHVAGYVLHNDYSEREFQLEQEGQWVKGKSCDSFAPLGPYVVTTDECSDAQNLRLWLSLNGEMLQDSNTSDMIFSIAKQVSYISQYMTLLPGDVISTGTPFGVGLGFNPPRYLKEGDIVELGIDGLGTSSQIAITYENSQN